MARKRLTDEERAEKRRRVWAEPTNKGKPGNADQWRNAAKDRVGILEDVNLKAYCTVLGLESMPKTQRELVKARNASMKEYHPDVEGGSTVRAQKINEAFLMLSEHLKRESS